MRFLSLMLICAIITAPTTATANAGNANAILSSIPSDVFEAAFTPGSPMRSGLNGANRFRWVSVGEQTGGMVPIQYGAIRGDQALVDRFFTVIDTSFSHQQRDGSFDYPATIDGAIQGKPAELTGAAFFLGASSIALLLLRASPLAPRYASRIDALIPRYRSSLLYLAQPSQTSMMAAADSRTANRLFFDAEAFYLGDKLANVPEASAVGDRFLDLGLSEQAPEGYFREHDGPDTSYNAISCMVLAETALFVPVPRIFPALRKSVAWELTRIHPDGRIDERGNTRTGQGKMTPDGHKYGVDYPEVVRMFAVAGALLHDPAASDAAARIAAFHKTHPEV